MTGKILNSYANTHKLSFIETLPHLSSNVITNGYVCAPMAKPCSCDRESLPANSSCLLPHLYEKCVDSYFGI